MIKKLLFSLGLFAFGYVVGKAVGRSETELAGHLEWQGEPDLKVDPDPRMKDAEFPESAATASNTIHRSP